jgi:hypothetical protein
MPNGLPARAAVHQQAQRWLAAGCLEASAEDPRAALRVAAGRKAGPSAVILDSRTLRSSPERGERAGYDGARRKKGAELHLAVDTLGLKARSPGRGAAEPTAVVSWPCTSRRPTPTTVPKWDALPQAVQEATGQSVDPAKPVLRPAKPDRGIDQAYAGQAAAKAAEQHGIDLEVVELAEAERGFVLLPRRPRRSADRRPCGKRIIGLLADDGWWRDPSPGPHVRGAW